MLARGIYLPPSQYESWFISDAIETDELAKILKASQETLQQMFS
jgi:glutamate-1-semialdehyde 2,1-aminomutase